jgi:hypothetical protein
MRARYLVFSSNLLLLIALATSCSNLKVVQIENEYGSVGKKVDANASGIRFYRPALHVWILPDNPAENIGTKTEEVNVGANKTTTNHRYSVRLTNFNLSTYRTTHRNILLYGKEELLEV